MAGLEDVSRLARLKVLSTQLVADDILVIELALQRLSKPLQRSEELVDI
jgi:hypothetical protein